MLLQDIIRRPRPERLTDVIRIVRIREENEGDARRLFAGQRERVQPVVGTAVAIGQDNVYRAECELDLPPARTALMVLP